MQPRNEIESYTTSTVTTSKFTEKEKNALKEFFSKAFIESKNDYGLDYNSFKRIADLKNEKICKKLFSVFDVNGDGGISFDDFETTLSIIARGMPNEKAKLALQMYQKESDPDIDREFIKEIDQEMREKGYENIIEVDEALGYVFPGKQEIIDRENWIQKHVIAQKELNPHSISQLDALYSNNHELDLSPYPIHTNDQVTDCFGLFSFLNDKLFIPILNKVHKICTHQMKFKRPYYEGYLSAKNLFENKWAIVCNGILGVYKSKENSDWAIDVPPIQSIHLQEVKITIINQNTFKLNSIEFTCEESELDEWIYTIHMNSGHVKICKYGSFAMDHISNCQFLIGGKQYFEDLAAELKKAEKEILMTCWYLTPQYYLTRPPKIEDRFDMILKERAEKGVKIYILVWNEPGVIGLRSYRIVEYFKQLHHNIMVIADPLKLEHLETKLKNVSQHQKSVVIDQRLAYVGGLDVAYNRYDDTFQIVDEDEKIHYGRDYVNSYFGYDNFGDPLESYIDRTKVPKMGWQDIQVKLEGDIIKDIVANFIQRWNISKMSHYPYIDMNKNELKKTTLPYVCKTKSIRSVGYIMGNSMSEQSLYKAYLDAVRKAEHYIYLEIPNFLTTTRNTELNYNPKNHFVKALVDKVAEKIKEGKKFKLYIVLPSKNDQRLDGMNGRGIMVYKFYLYSSLLLGDRSLFGELSAKFPNVDLNEYISLCSIRNWGKFKSGHYCTEIVYVHSKIMIVDDRLSFITSANINDRSLVGYRDSELGIRIEDIEFVDSKMNGEPYKAGKFALNFRLGLFRKYLGLPKDGSGDDQIMDPITCFDKVWNPVSNKNTEIYRKVFKKIEYDIRNLDEFHHLYDFQKTLTPEEEEMVKSIQGVLVQFPRYFMREEFENNEESRTTGDRFVDGLYV